MYFIFNRKINNKYHISNNKLLASGKLFLNDYQEVEYSEPKGKKDDQEPHFI